MSKQKFRNAVTAKTSQADQFDKIWQDALDAHKRICRKNLAQIPHPKTIDCLKQEIEASQYKFKRFREIRGRLWSSLAAIIGPVEILGGAAAEGASNSFPAAPVIVGATLMLIKGAKGVSQSYDYIQALFDDMEPILSRLRVHTQGVVPSELRIIYVRILACVLEILGVSTKYIRQGRGRRYLKRTLRPEEDRASDLTRQLGNLVDEETAMVVALNLHVSGEVLEKTTVIDEKIDVIADAIQQISIQIKASQNKQPGVTMKDLNYTIPLRLPSSRNRNFTGRETQLSALHEYFTDFTDPPQTSPCIFAITGTGGMGKTQIALEYAYRNDDYYSSIFWLSAATEESLQSSLVNVMQRIVEEQVKVITWPQPSEPDYNLVALKLGIAGLINEAGVINTEEGQIKGIIKAVFRWFQSSTRPWLLIFDNADDLESFELQDYLPNHGNGAILITSRRPELGNTTEHIDLEGLDQRDAVELLHRLIRIPNPFQVAEMESDANTLVETLGYMPLAICHAGSYILESKISLVEYLSRYKTTFMTLQSRKPKFGWSYRSDTAATTWEISFSQIEKQDKEAAELLLACSYFDREEIREDLWDTEESEDPNLKQQRQDKFLLLASYSLIKVLRFSVFSIHPVVHAWSRERLANPSSRLHPLTSAIKILGGAAAKDSLSRLHPSWDPQEEKRLLKHIAHLDKCLPSTLSDSLPPAHLDEDLLDAINNISIMYNIQIKPSDALRWGEVALSGRERLFSKTHPEYESYLNSLHQIGAIYANLAKFDTAIEFYQKALEGKEEVLGKTHESTLKTMQNLGITLAGQGKCVEGIEIFEQVLPELEKLHGPGSVIVNKARFSLADMYRRQKKFDASFELYSKVLVNFKTELGMAAPLTRLTITEMASIHRDCGRFEEAINSLQEVIDVEVELYGEGDIEVMGTVYRVAKILSAQGKSQEALALFKQVLGKEEEVMGIDDPNLAESFYSIAICYDDLGDRNEAVEWCRRAAEGFAKAAGEEFPRTLEIKEYLNSLEKEYTEGKARRRELKEVLIFHDT
ncbi:hypothetical protein TWF694_004188 [Orbilia ellipsospora]|uniref:Fungal STAND N-terminal Goodbye domain-containing protein n=1 Tax=Orbilia ellipsospora TaxID=2528407 RepID=A0AAV9WXA9_9PEZI